MCEIFTILAAAVFTGLFAAARRAGRPAKALAAAALAFWGAAIMWAVDCVANRMEGEPLFDLSREDAVLGAIILAAGLALYGVMAVRERRASARA